MTSAIEGEVVPGAKAVEHTMEGKPWVHPDSVAADAKHTFKVLALDAKTGKTVWEQTAYEGPVYDARHRRSSFAGPTAATDGKMVFAYFGPEGLYAYDFDGKLAWKVVEKFPTLGLGTGTSPVLYQNLVIIQRDEDNGERLGDRRLRQDDRQGSLEDEARRCRSAGRRRCSSTPAAAPSSSPTAPSSSSPTTRRRGKELWRTNGVESNAIHTPLVGHGLVIVTAGYPGEEGHRDPARATSPDDKRVAWEYAKGTGYVLSNILYGDYVYLLDRQRHRHLPRPEDRRGQVRRRPRAGAGAVHGIAGRVRRLRRDDQRGRRHVHAQGRPAARDRPHQHRRRAGVFVAGDRQRPHLHPRREASVCDRV